MVTGRLDNAEKIFACTLPSLLPMQCVCLVTPARFSQCVWNAPSTEMQFSGSCKRDGAISLALFAKELFWVWREMSLNHKFPSNGKKDLNLWGPAVMGCFRVSDPAPGSTSVILRMVRMDSSSGYETEYIRILLGPFQLVNLTLDPLLQPIIAAFTPRLLAKFYRVTSSPSSVTLLWFSLEREGRGNGASWTVLRSEKQDEVSVCQRSLESDAFCLIQSKAHGA